MKYIYFTVSSIIIAYIVVIIFVYFYQRNLLYHPSENNYQNDTIQFNHQEIFIKVNNEIKLKSWIINKDLKNFKTLVFFHGNAGELSACAIPCVPTVVRVLFPSASPRAIAVLSLISCKHIR